MVRARPVSLPAEVTFRSRRYRLLQKYKYATISSVGLYSDGEKKLVLKRYTGAPLLGLPTAWAGRLMASYEACVIQRLHDLPGVPRLLGRYGAFGIVHEHVPGKPLTRDSEVNEEFFPALRHLLTRIHERGVAYIDLEKPGNILLGGDGLPYLIDFQIAFFWPERFLGGTWPLRLVRRMLQKSDMYHLRKHWRRVRPDQLSRKQIAASRCKPWPVRLGNMLFAPLKKLRRMIQGRSRRRRRR